MILTDPSRLRVNCSSTSIEECESLGIFKELDKELKESKRVGTGLAAPQIGKYIRACIIRLPETKKREEVRLNMINPVIEEYDKPEIIDNEGCLSLPSVCVPVKRSMQVTASWIDFDKKELLRAVFYRLEAVVFAHEWDHCEGILITDRAFKQQEKVGRNSPCPECLANGVQIKFKKCKEHFNG